MDYNSDYEDAICELKKQNIQMYVALILAMIASMVFLCDMYVIGVLLYVAMVVIIGYMEVVL